MVQIICTAITAAAAVICGYMAYAGTKRDKEMANQRKKDETRASQRAEESHLSLRLMNANCKLTVGVATALKHGHCNGEVEEGLAAVKDAQGDYEKFLEGIAIAHITK